MKHMEITFCREGQLDINIILKPNVLMETNFKYLQERECFQDTPDF